MMTMMRFLYFDPDNDVLIFRQSGNRGRIGDCAQWGQCSGGICIFLGKSSELLFSSFFSLFFNFTSPSLLPLFLLLFLFLCFFSPVLPSCCFFSHSSFLSPFSLLNFSLTSGLPLLYRECQSKCCCEVRKKYFKIMLLVFILTNFEKRSRGW